MGKVTELEVETKSEGEVENADEREDASEVGEGEMEGIVAVEL